MPASSRARAADHQLLLPLAWLSEDAVLQELRGRGIAHVRQVRFRNNRSRLISLSADRSRLSLHECFRSAGPEVVDAIAVFAGATRDSLSYRRAIDRMRAWHAAQVEGGEQDRDAAPAPCCGTAAQQQMLAQCYRQLNRAHFSGVLPDLTPVRLSDRMTRRLGHVAYGRSSVERAVTEIALNVDLMLPGNERALIDTLLHEMAHAEAWLSHGHRGHGGTWRRIAARVGCDARACSDMKIRRRRRGTPATDRVPELFLL